MEKSLTNHNIELHRRNIPGPEVRCRNHHDINNFELAARSIIVAGLNADVRDLYDLAGLYPEHGIHRIGYLWWELADFPDEWLSNFELLDEIWVGSRFIQQTLKRIGLPVNYLPPYIEFNDNYHRSKHQFGLDPSRYTVGYVFDPNSRIARKNPQAFIETAKLLSNHCDDIEFAIKITPPTIDSLVLQNIRRICSRYDIRLFEVNWPHNRVLDFISSCDCYLSLHRSEGFGLTLAEAMALGTLAVATGYSGNVDFMNNDNSLLVDYYDTKITEEESDTVYRHGYQWAEPKAYHAAELIRYAIRNPQHIAELTGQAQTTITTNFTYTKFSSRLLNLLDG